MSMTKTQRKRFASATWLVFENPPNAAVAAYNKQVKMRAAAANRRVEMRKGKTK